MYTFAKGQKKDFKLKFLIFFAVAFFGFLYVLTFFSSHLGGHTASAVTSSTEYIFGNGTIKTGPNLPVPLRTHCVVRLDNGTAMVIGKY